MVTHHPAGEENHHKTKDEKDNTYVLLERGEGRGREREREMLSTKFNGLLWRSVASVIQTIISHNTYMPSIHNNKDAL